MKTTKLKPLTETQIKGQIKEYLTVKNYYWYWLVQGLGSFRGLPDLAVHSSKKYCCFPPELEEPIKVGKVIYLEVKSEKGIMSEHQLRFKANCEKNNIPYFVVRSLEAVRDIFEKLFWDDEKN